MDALIPFNRPADCRRAIEYLAQSLASGEVSGDGPFTRRARALLEAALPGSRVFLTTSCTDALEMAALLLDIGPGDEVIMPSFTFVSTVNAFVLRGARPVFADVREDTLNLDEHAVARLCGPRTRAIVPVHYAGVGCEMDAILATGVPVVEDNAHGLYAEWRGRPLGTMGALATQSFHQSKNFSCGEGGALVVNDARFAERAEIIREKGTDRSKFFRGEVAKYGWVDVGSSFLPADLLAAVLVAQLEERERIQAARARICAAYASGLAGWAERNGVRLPVTPPWCRPSWHIFHLLLPSLEARQGLMMHLRAKGIIAASHYLPLHLSPMGLRMGGQVGDCPVTERVSDQLLRLPLFADLPDADVARVIDTVMGFEGL